MKQLRKSALILVAAIAIVAAGTAAWRTLGTPASSAAADPAACGAQYDQRLYGHIGSLTRKGDDFELRFDPAWFVSGVTANTAAAEDGAVASGEPVPNDNYVVEEGHRLLAYLVPADADVTVLAGALGSSGFPSTTISVAELAQLVRGEEPIDLFEPLESGVWIDVDVDRVCSIQQQYRP